MTRLEELIAKLCPEGVEWKALGEVATLIRGSGLPKSDFTDKGIGCIHYGQIYTYYGAFAYKTKSFVSEKTAEKLKKVSTNDIIITSTSENLNDVCKAVVWLGDEDIVTGGHATIIKHNQNAKFIAYYTQSAIFFEEKRKYAYGTKVIDVSANNLAKIKIPLPPLAVQEEIVKILDNFTELTAELSARKKQYEYYREKLLTFGDDVEWKALGEIATLIRGNGLPKSDFTDEGIGCIHYGQIYTYYGTFANETKSFVSESTAEKLKKVSTNDIIITSTSENLNDVCKAVVWLGEEEIVTGGHATIIKHNQNAKFLTYYTQTSAFYEEKRKYAYGTKVIDISAKNLAKIKIPIPPLAEQEHIVATLDRFNALCHDLTSGLPAEIAARQKQYEYYRDTLLSFKEVKVCTAERD